MIAVRNFDNFWGFTLSENLNHCNKFCFKIARHSSAIQKIIFPVAIFAFQHLLDMASCLFLQLSLDGKQVTDSEVVVSIAFFN